MKKKSRVVPEVVIPKGYEIDEIMDTDGDDFDEQPILQEEVKVRFER